MADKDVNPFELEWVEANPRPYWTPEFWESCRPDPEAGD